MSVIRNRISSLPERYSSALFQFDEVIVDGRDAIQFISNFMTADLNRLKVNECCDAFFCDARGWILDIAVVVRGVDRVRVLVARGRGQDIASHLNRYHIKEELTIHQTQENLHSMLISGSQAEFLLERYFEITTPIDAYQQFPEKGGSNFFSTRTTNATLTIVDWISSRIFLLIVPEQKKSVLEEFLGANEISNATDEIITYARLQQGWPLASDIPKKTIPQEVGLNDRAISFTKGCYLGQETVARLDALGHVNRRLVVFDVEQGRELVVGDSVASGGDDVSHVTSVGYFSEDDKALVMAIMPLKALQDKRGLTVAGRRATIVPSALLDSIAT